MRFRSLEKTVDDVDPAALPLLGIEWNSEDREDNWLISYADLLSVIFAIVVLLFGRTVTLSAPLSVDPAQADAVAVPAPLVEPAPLAESPPLVERAASAPVAALVTTPATAPADAPATAMTDSDGPSQEDRLAALVEQRFRGQIETRRRERGLSLAIPEVALFDSARARLQESAHALLTELVATLREAGEVSVSVDGHTDSVPLQGGEFESNWDLAAARANAVTRYLLEQGFEPTRLHSVSYADTRPVADNATAQGRAANRRVELQIEFPTDGSPAASPPSGAGEG